jgi:hypothetical protein
MGEDDGVDLIGVNAQLLLQMLVHLKAAALVAFVMVLGGAFFVAQAGIDENLVLAGIDIVAVDGFQIFCLPDPSRKCRCRDQPPSQPVLIG